MNEHQPPHAPCGPFHLFGSEAPDALDEFASALRGAWFHVIRDVMGRDADDVGGKQGFWTLSMLQRGPARMSNLADGAHVSSAQLTAIVDRLEERGLVARERSTEDRRVITVALTDEGREALKQAKLALRERFAEWTGRLTPEELTQLTELLQRLTEKNPEKECN